MSNKRNTIGTSRGFTADAGSHFSTVDKKSSHTDQDQGTDLLKNVRREKLFICIAILLVLAIIFGTVFRSIGASSNITYEDIMDYSGITCTINDRFEQPIYKDGAVTNYDVFGNLVGYEGHIHNSLLYKHFDLLMPKKVSAIRGYRTLETKPRVMTTTLISQEDQSELIDLFQGKSGCCFSYNYVTGEIYTALSLPACNPNNDNSAYINRCFQSVYIPGSTMKIVTAALAIDQGKNVDKMKFTCEKSYTLSDGNDINCAGVHGKIGFSNAIGYSCNSYFAQLITELDLDKSLKTLKELGFTVNGATENEEVLDGLSKTVSSVSITNTASFKNVWGLIGQGRTEVNPIDMARFAAAVVNEGKTAQPYIISSVTNPNKEDQVIYQAQTETINLLSEKTAKKTASYWKEGIDPYYYSNQGMSERIDYAKTGTAEQGDGNEDKLLIGVIEDAKTAFFIVIEDCAGGPAPMTIANKLADLLPTYS